MRSPSLTKSETLHAYFAREEVRMTQLTRTIRYSGGTLVLAAAGVLTAGGVAGAHDATQGDASGVVTAVGANSFSLRTWGNGNETVDTSGSTTYTESGTPNDPAGVAVGDAVDVKLDPTAVAPTALQVTVLLDRVSGTVTDVSGSSITLNAGWGAPREVEVSSGTEYFDGGSATPSVTDGEFVTAFGSLSGSAPFVIDATFVDVDPGATPPVRPGPWTNSAHWLAAFHSSVDGVCHHDGTPVTPPTPTSPSATPSVAAHVQPSPAITPPTAPAPVVPGVTFGHGAPGFPSSNGSPGSGGRGFGTPNGGSASGGSPNGGSPNGGSPNGGSPNGGSHGFHS
jgi:hypothetical protein